MGSNHWYPHEAAGEAHPCKRPTPHPNPAQGTDSRARLAWRRCCWAPGRTPSPSPRAAVVGKAGRVSECRPHRPPCIQRNPTRTLTSGLRGPSLPFNSTHLLFFQTCIPAGWAEPSGDRVRTRMLGRPFWKVPSPRTTMRAVGSCGAKISLLL